MRRPSSDELGALLLSACRISGTPNRYWTAVSRPLTISAAPRATSRSPVPVSTVKVGARCRHLVRGRPPVRGRSTTDRPRSSCRQVSSGTSCSSGLTVRIVFGNGAVNGAHDEIHRLGLSAVTVVCTPALCRRGARLARSISEPAAGPIMRVGSGPGADRDADVARLVSASHGSEGFLAIGGGSAIRVARHAAGITGPTGHRGPDDLRRPRDVDGTRRPPLPPAPPPTSPLHRCRRPSSTTRSSRPRSPSTSLVCQHSPRSPAPLSRSARATATRSAS